MRLILVVLIFSSETVFSKYYEKRRFDRSIYDDSESFIIDEQLSKKQLTFTDYNTHFKAYKSKEENDCYLEKLGDASAEDLPGNKLQQKTLYAPTEALTKLEAWRIAGGNIVDFCQGRKLILLQTTIPIPERTLDPFFNVIPQDENDIVARRVADVVLTPLISRAKRQIALEERRKLEENVGRTRARRQAQSPRGRFRGQTQSQYLNIGGDDQKEGKAEAEATQQSSHAVVSGSRGMGQAQSMSMGSIGCEDCPKYTLEGTPERYIQLPSAINTGTNYPGAASPGARSGILSGTSVGGTSYPGTFPTSGQSRANVIQPGRFAPGTTPGAAYPSGASPGAVMTDGRKVYPGAAAPSDGVVPGTAAGRGGVTYPGGVPDSITGAGVPYRGGAPGTALGAGVAYPGRISVPTGDVAYSGGVPSTSPGAGVAYPGAVPSPTAGGEVAYPSGVRTPAPGAGVGYPGAVPSPTAGAGVAYPSAVPSPKTGGGVVYPSGARSPSTGDGVSYPGVPSTIPGAGVAYPGGLPGTTVGGGVAYPSGVHSPVTGGITYPSVVRGPSARDGVTYLGGVPSTITGAGVAYPGGLPSTIPGAGVAYPDGLPGTTTGGGVAYPGAVPGTAIEGGVAYPGSIPGSVAGSGIAYPSTARQLPGTAGGNVAYPGTVLGTTSGGSATYPDGTPGAVPGGMPRIPTTGGAGTYPGDTSGTPTLEGKVPYPGTVAGTPITGDGIIYPSNIAPGGKTGVAYSEGTKSIPGQITESKASTDAKVYPTGQFPGATGTKAAYPDMIQPGSLPSGIPGETIATGGEGAVNYPGSIPPLANQLRQSVHYPGRFVPAPMTPGDVAGAAPPGTGTYSKDIVPGMTGHFVTGDRMSYSDDISRRTGGAQLYPSGTIPETAGPSIGPSAIPAGPSPDAGTMVSYPDGTQVKVGQIGYPSIPQVGLDSARVSKVGAGQPVVSYPSNIMRYPEGSVIQQPGLGKYLGSPATIPSDYSVQQGRYPGVATWHDDQGRAVPGGINRQVVGQYPSGGQTVQQYPALQYPTTIGSAAGSGERSQYSQQIGAVPPREDDNSDSQASSSVKETDSGTQASASAQGKHGQGTAQSQVTGTYSGSGSFSAQAGSSDNNKSVQTEISGGKDGTVSNAQGIGGYGKSQTQVQLDSESGATSTGAQSSGWNHGTNSQVQANSRGGMADAQANGEGSTSSQAQIGFQPYLKTDEKLEKRSRPFRGGGSASAQSGTYRGQSQSQLEGSFQYGITYTGAAQAGSGSGAAASRKPFNFSLADTELFKPFKPYNVQVAGDNKSEVTNASSDVDYEYNQNKLQQGLQASSSSRKIVIANETKENPQGKVNKQNQSVEKSQVDDTMYDYGEEYDDEDYDTSQMQISMNSKFSDHRNMEQNNSDYQSQTIHVTTGNEYDVRVNQNSNTGQTGDMLLPGQSLSGYTVPPGFRGKVISVAGGKTIAHGDGKSQSQTVSLTPVEPKVIHENKSPLSETRSLKTNHERLTENHKQKFHRNNSPRVRDHLEYSKPTTNVPIKPSYYTVTNSFAGKMDGDRSSPKKYEHRYYTKSSTCGYFTFSCNIVYGSNGRTKICKPKMPTHPDGTPMKC